MADGSPIHDELPDLANGSNDFASQDLAGDVSDPLTEFVDCGADPDEDGAPAPQAEGANPGAMECLACPQVGFY